MISIIIGSIILGISGGATIFIIIRKKKQDKTAVSLEFRIGPVLSKNQKE